jgi:hypothetical protein
MPCFFKA